MINNNIIMNYWTDIKGKKIEYKDLKTDHLINIIKFVERKAKEKDGDIIDWGGYDLGDIYTIEGNENDWLKEYNYKGLKKELKLRNIKK